MDFSRYKNWREVAGLSEAAQKDLLAAGDPAERVWSIWALGLRLGKDALGDLQEDFDLEALPGIRCQLIVVMAGLGERDLIRGIALEDPDPVVRATACQYVVRTLPAKSVSALDFAIERMRSDVPRVQRAMFEEAQSGRLRFPESVLVEFLANSNLETRQLSLGSLAALPRLSEETIRALADRVGLEPEPLLLRACIELYLRHGIAADLVRAAHDARVAAVCEVLSALHRSGVHMPWAELAPMTSRSDPDISLAALECLAEPPEPDAIRWMSDLVAALSANSGTRQSARSPLSTFQWKALAVLYRAVAPDTIAFFNRSVATTLLEGLLAGDEYDDDDEEIAAASPEEIAKRELLARRVAGHET